MSLASCKQGTNDILTHGLYQCTAEFTTGDVGSRKFIEAGLLWQFGDLQSEEEAYEGEYSVKLTEENPYGMTVSLQGLQPGNYIEAIVWRKSDTKAGTIILAGPEEVGVYVSSVATGLSNDNGWEELLLTYVVPEGVDELGLYLYQPGKGAAYFDNFTINYLPRIVYPSYPASEVLQIEFDDKTKSTLAEFAERALQQGLISSDEKEVLPAKIIYEGKTMEALIRLKGDWPDHLKNEKWSLRIHITDGQTILGCTKFSIQSPHTRSYLHEWVMHKMLEREGLLATRYEFMPVSMNGESRGLYAFEEHFDEDWPLRHDREPGLILKLDEEGFWASVLYNMQHQQGAIVPYFEAASILPYGLKKVLANEKLHAQWLDAQDKMYAYKAADASARHYFDLDKVAQFLAITDICKSHHALQWHNQRLHYSPSLQQLEFIAFDGYSEYSAEDPNSPMFFRHDTTAEGLINSKVPTCNFLEFANFRRPYAKYLLQFSDSTYLAILLKELAPEINRIEASIKREFAQYHYDRNYLTRNAAAIRTQIAAAIAPDKFGHYYPHSPDPEYHTTSEIPVEWVGLIAHLEDFSNDSSTLSILNYFTEPLVVVSTMDEGNKQVACKFEIEAFAHNAAPTLITVQGKVQSISFSTREGKVEMRFQVFPWRRPQLPAGNSVN